MAKWIPHHVIFIILSKLPLKSLKRFTCVHKSWADLLENSDFMSMFRSNFLSNHHCYDNDTSLLLINHGFIFGFVQPYLLLGDKFENTVQFDWDLPIWYPPNRKRGAIMKIFRCCVHGIFLFQNYKDYVLWNPTTEEFKILPPSPLETNRAYMVEQIYPLGFGYDPIRDDFKVIRRLKYDGGRKNREYAGASMCRLPWDNSLFEIYSLRSNSWRKLDIPIDETLNTDEDDHFVYMNGVCHWLDLSHRWVKKCLVTLNVSIAVISKDAEITTFHIWILGELGVKESWTKLFIVGPFTDVTHPIRVGKKSDIFFVKENGQLAVFDLSTLKLDVIATKGYFADYRLKIYKESHLSIGRTTL